MTQHATYLGDIVCCDVGYMDAIATHVSLCILGGNNCVCHYACDNLLGVHNSVPMGLLVSV